MSDAEQLNLHQAIAEHLSGRRPIQSSDLPQLVLSGLKTGSRPAVLVLIQLALLKAMPDPLMARALYPLAFMRTDQPLVDQAMLNAPLRSAQVKVAALNGMSGIAIAAFRALEREAGEDGPNAVLRTMTAFTLLTSPLDLPAADWLPLVLAIPSDAIAQTSAILTNAAGNIGRDEAETRAGLEALEDFDLPIRDLGAFLFTFRIHKMLGLEDLESVIDQLEALDPARREALLAGEGLNRTADNRQTLIQMAWLAESRGDGFNARVAASRLELLASRLTSWPDPVLAEEVLCARIVMLSEFADAPLEALDLVEDALKANPENARMRRERVKIFIQLKRFAEVADDAERLLQDAASVDRVDQVYAARDVAIAVAETGDLAAAADQFDSAAALAAGGETLISLSLRLEADALLLRWRLGERQLVLEFARGLLERAEAVMSDLTEESRADLVRGLYALGEIFSQDLGGPGWDKDMSIIGAASRGSPPGSNLPKPVLMTAWYRLADVEKELGLDAGLETALRARRPKGMLVAFESIRLGRGNWDGINSADPETAANAIIERGLGWAWLRRSVRGEREVAKEMFALVDDLPWEGDLQLDDVDDRVFTGQALIVSLAFALSRGDTDWESRLTAVSGTEGIGGLLDSLPAATSSLDAYEADLTPLWAVRRLLLSDYNVQELFIATAHLGHWLSQLSGPGLVAEAVGPVIARHWRAAAVERTFDLIAPALAQPAILSATENVRSVSGVTRLLLAVLPWTGVSVPSDTVSIWREQAEPS